MSESFITIGAGCYSCAEALYQQVRGVTSTEVGYANGKSSERPRDEDVMSDASGHAEVVRIGFDPQEIALQQILEIFFTIHDPTSLNKQGDSVGVRYRSGIYVENGEQKEIAETLIKQVNDSGELGRPVVTEVEPLRNYWAAPEESQNSFAKDPESAYCTAVIGPKVKKFRETAAQYLAA